MKTSASPPSWVIPTALGVAMFALVLVAIVAPLSVAIPADSNCEYGTCPAATNSLLPYEIALVVLVVAAVVLAVLIILRRRRPPTKGPVEAWGGQPPAAAGGAPEGPAGPGAEVAPAAYIETPEDVGAPPPSVPKPPPGATGGEAAPEGDIDSLMQELDKISNEILKRGSPKSPPTQEEEGSGGNAGT